MLCNGTYVISRLTPSYVQALQATLLPKFAEALKHAHGELDERDLLCKALAEEAQVWVVQHKGDMALWGVVTTEVVKYEKLTALRIITLSGACLDKWARELDEHLMAFAKEQGASRLEAFGRKGLIRKLEPLAFQTAYTVLTKEVA